MTKVATVQSRIDPGLKQNAEQILKTLGLTSSQAINAFYAQIVLVQGLPFDVKIPNKETRQAMQELDSGNVETFDTMADVWKSVVNDD